MERQDRPVTLLHKISYFVLNEVNMVLSGRTRPLVNALLDLLGRICIHFEDNFGSMLAKEIQVLSRLVW